MTTTAAPNGLLFSQAYEEKLVPALFLPAAQVLMEHAQPQPGERVLDVACGTGVVARQIAPRVGENGRVAALDLNPAMIAVARSVAPPTGATIEWHEGSAQALPFEDGTFDLVLCQQGMQFFPDRLAALREMRRVLVAEGRVFAAVQQSLDRNPVYQAFTEAANKHLKVGSFVGPFVMGDPDLLLGLLNEAGFANAQVIPFTHPVHFASGVEFVNSTLFASAAVLQAFADIDEHERAVLATAVYEDIRDALAPHESANGLTLPIATWMGSGLKR